jgi:hypothetical protein
MDFEVTGTVLECPLSMADIDQVYFGETSYGTETATVLTSVIYLIFPWCQ